MRVRPIIYLTFALILFTYFSVDYVYALESQGTKIPTTNSKNICGDVICSSPMTIQEKIQIYLQSLQEKYSDSTIFQQSLGSISSAKQVLQGTALTKSQPVISKELPKFAPEITSSPTLNSNKDVASFPQDAPKVVSDKPIIIGEAERDVIGVPVERKDPPLVIPTPEDETTTDSPGILEYPSPEIGWVDLDENNEPFFQETLAGLTGEYPLNTPEGSVLEFPIVVIDYVLGDYVFDLDCGFSNGPMVFQTGPNPLTCTYTDSQGNSDTESATITIVHQDPIIGIKYEEGEEEFISPGISSLGGEYNINFSVTSDDLPPIAAFDQVSGQISDNVNCNDISEIFSSDGNKEFSCSYRDIAGKETTESVPITIVHQAPEIGFVYYDETQNDYVFETQFAKLSNQYIQDSPNGANVPVSIMAIDYVEGDYSTEVDCNIPQDGIFPVGDTLINCTYTDRGGLSDTKSATITVIEAEKPSLVLEFEGQYYPFPEGTSEYQTDDPAGLEFVFSIVAIDNALGDFSTDGLNCEGIPRDFVFRPGNNEVTCGFTDIMGNSVSNSMMIIVEYVEPATQEIDSPSDDAQSLWVFVPDDATLTADNSDGISLDFEAIAIDEYEGEVQVECDPPPGSLFPVGENIVTCTAVNSSGESTQDFFVLTIDAPSGEIPSWIKQNALWWAQDQIDDQTFANGIQYFVKEGIIVVPPSSDTVSGQSSGIPDWIKQNAGWWATDQIPDSAFIDGLQYLISNGIIEVN